MQASQHGESPFQKRVRESRGAAQLSRSRPALVRTALPHDRTRGLVAFQAASLSTGTRTIAPASGRCS